ncbi:MAG: SUF system NifU family Fe-S cluster assembly protein [Spirochaetaceae bacterium]|nr:SUF system NifU family Fe-S cluster assembly protein [Spirochaetaceae bacterium]
MKSKDSSDLDNLYRGIILDHYKSPRNMAKLSHISDECMYENPSCGDSLKLEIITADDGRIESARFDGYGCAICTASASLMTEGLPGKTHAEARSFIDVFCKVFQGEEPVSRLEEWGDLVALGSVIQFPLRIKCATLAWHVLEKTLEE